MNWWPVWSLFGWISLIFCCISVLQLPLLVCVAFKWWDCWHDGLATVTEGLSDDNKGKIAGEDGRVNIWACGIVSWELETKGRGRAGGKEWVVSRPFYCLWLLTSSSLSVPLYFVIFFLSHIFRLMFLIIHHWKTSASLSLLFISFLRSIYFY